MVGEGLRYLGMLAGNVGDYPTSLEMTGQAREVFADTVLPRDFDTIEVPFAERGEPHLVKGGALPDPAVREPLYPSPAQPL